MASEIYDPMEGIIMCYEKDCYFCKHLCYFDINNVNAYLCTLTGIPYQKTKLNIQCENFIEDMVE